MRVGCLVKTLIMVREFQRLYSYEKKDCGYLEFCETFNSCCGESGIKFKGKKFPYLDSLVVDVSYMLSKSQEDDIYRLASKLQICRDNVNKLFFLIFLQ